MSIDRLQDDIYDNESRKERFNDIADRLNGLLDKTLYNPKKADYVFRNTEPNVELGLEPEIACFIKTAPDINRLTGEVIPGRESHLIKLISVSGKKDQALFYRIELYDDKTQKVNQTYFIDPFTKDPNIVHTYRTSMQQEFRTETLDIGMGFAELARILTDCSYGRLVLPEDDDVVEYVKEAVLPQSYTKRLLGFLGIKRAKQ